MMLRQRTVWEQRWEHSHREKGKGILIRPSPRTALFKTTNGAPP
jgi:hypothetical protein